MADNSFASFFSREDGEVNNIVMLPILLIVSPLLASACTMFPFVGPFAALRKTIPIR